MKIRINAISSEGIDKYRVLRLMPDGSHVTIPGVDWQDSPVFNVHTGGGYVLQVRDVKGNVAEDIVSIGEQLQITAYGGYTHQGRVWVAAGFNQPAEIRIKWAITVQGEEYDYADMELYDLGWNSEYKFGHAIQLPQYYVGALHHYFIYARTPLGRAAHVNGRYIITSNLLAFSNPAVLLTPDDHNIIVDLNNIELTGNKASGNVFENDYQHVLKSYDNTINSETMLLNTTSRNIEGHLSERTINITP